MRKKMIFALLSFSLAFSCQTGPDTVADKDDLKAEDLIINITSDKGLSLVTFNAKRGTTVIWVNKTSEPQEILFAGKQIVSACGTPVNFLAGKEGLYESAKIPLGGTASLCFSEKGRHEYELRSSKTSSSPSMRDHRGSFKIK
jgi:hypothetical protein